MKKTFVIAILASLMLMLLSSCEGENAYIGYWRINEIYAGDVSMTMQDVIKAQQKYVKDRTYIYGLLGNYKDMDMDFLRTLGPVRLLSLEEIFGY